MNKLNEVERAIYQQRKGGSGLGNAEIKRRFGLKGWQFNAALENLKNLGLITGDEKYYSIMGRPKKH